MKYTKKIVLILMAVVLLVVASCPTAEAKYYYKNYKGTNWSVCYGDIKVSVKVLSAS